MNTTHALFVGIFAVLAMATLAGRWLRHRAAGPNAVLDNLNARIDAWWAMVIVVGLAFAFGKGGVIVLFALLSLLALREFVTLTYTRRSDHLALALAFYVALPVQYALIWIEWYGLFSIFIPVYGFLILPIFAALRADPNRFFDRIAAVQWALMLAVFCLSHVPALLTLQIPGYGGRELLLIASWSSLCSPPTCCSTSGASCWAGTRWRRRCPRQKPGKACSAVCSAPPRWVRRYGGSPPSAHWRRRRLPC